MQKISSTSISREVIKYMTLEKISPVSKVAVDPICLFLLLSAVVFTSFSNELLKPSGKVASYFFICSLPLETALSALADSGPIHPETMLIMLAG